MGQIYVPLVNWLLAAATLGAVIGFGTSDALAGAYGIAVSLLMAITTLLAALVAIQWGYSPIIVIAVNGFFLVIDCIFFAANSTKFLEGGWFPLVLAGRHRVPDADLARRRQAGRARARRAAPARRGSDRDRRQQVPCTAARHRGVHGVHAEGRSARADPIRQAQPCACTSACCWSRC